MRDLKAWAVPGGTVLLTAKTARAPRGIPWASPAAAAHTCDKSASPPGAAGVPTQRKTTSAPGSPSCGLSNTCREPSAR